MQDEKVSPSTTPEQESLAEARRILSVISHELRTPVNNVLGFSQLIGMDDEASDRVKRWADLGHTAGLRLSDMVDVLVMFAASDGLAFDENKTHAPGLRTYAADFSPASLLRDVGEEAGRLCGAEASQISISVASGFDHATSGERHLRRALTSLACNAVQYSNGEKVRLVAETASATSDDSDAGRQLFVFLVEDDGPGIPADQIDSCFKPFVRGSGVPGIGLGLGIPLASRIIEHLEGSLTYSNIEGQPSRFRIELPSSPTVDGA